MNIKYARILNIRFPTGEIVNPVRSRLNNYRVPGRVGRFEPPERASAPLSTGKRRLEAGGRPPLGPQRESPESPESSASASPAAPRSARGDHRPSGPRPRSASRPPGSAHREPRLRVWGAGGSAAGAPRCVLVWFLFPVLMFRGSPRRWSGEKACTKDKTSCEPRAFSPDPLITRGCRLGKASRACPWFCFLPERLYPQAPRTNTIVSVGAR